jgi:hypothetical protein
MIPNRRTDFASTRSGTACLMPRKPWTSSLRILGMFPNSAAESGEYLIYRLDLILLTELAERSRNLGRNAAVAFYLLEKSLDDSPLNGGSVVHGVIVKCCGSAGHDQAASLGWLSLE